MVAVGALVLLVLQCPTSVSQIGSFDSSFALLSLVDCSYLAKVFDGVIE